MCVIPRHESGGLCGSLAHVLSPFRLVVVEQVFSVVHCFVDRPATKPGYFQCDSASVLIICFVVANTLWRGSR